MIERVLATWGAWQARRPRAAILALGVLTAGALAALPRFQIDPDVASLFPRGDETIDLLLEAGSSQESARTTFLLVRGEELETRLGELLATLEESPYLKEVAGTKLALGGERVERARRAPLHFLPEDTLDALEQRLAPTGRSAALAESKRLLAEDPALGREVVMRDPLGLRWILEEAARAALPGNFDPASPYLLVDGGRAALVRLRGERDAFDVDYSRALLADVEARCRDFDVHPIGGYQVARTDSGRIRSDMESSLYWGIPMLLGFLVISTRSLYLSLALHLPVGLATLWALGYGGLMLGPLTPLAVSSAAILMGMGMDFSIHYAQRYSAERRSAPHAEAVLRTHRGTGRALFYGMATSIVAFLTIGMGSFRSLESFGILLSLGLVLAWLSALAVMPLLLVRMRAGSLEREPGRHWRALARLVRTRAGAGLALLVALLATLGWIRAIGAGVSFDADPDHLRPEEDRLSPMFEELGALIGFSPVPALVLVPTAVPVDAIARAADELETSGRIALSEGPHRSMPTSERRARVESFRERTGGWMEATLEDMRAIGFRPEAFRPGLEEWQSLLQAEPDASLDEHRMDWGGTSYWRASFHPRQVATSSAEREGFREALTGALPEGSRILDPSALADRIGPLLERDFRLSAAVSALTVVLLTFVGVRAWRATLVALAPVFAALGITLGLASFLGWPLHPGNFIAIPLLLGLGVDYGIHIVLRSLEGGADALLDTGVAVWRTSATTCLGFGSLISAKSPALSSLGALTLVGMLACFLASMILVPVLLRRALPQA